MFCSCVVLVRWNGPAIRTLIAVNAFVAHAAHMPAPHWGSGAAAAGSASPRPVQQAQQGHNFQQLLTHVPLQEKRTIGDRKNQEIFFT